jgi:hypothetical protein
MTKVPGELEASKPISKAARQARKAFRQVDAAKAMTEHQIAEKAFSKNRGRLKAERRARETAANLATCQTERTKNGTSEGKREMTRPTFFAPRRWTVEDDKMKSLAARGLSVRRVAILMNRSFLAVQSRASKLNVTFQKRSSQGDHERRPSPVK